jgi:hypothetical protein
MPIDPSPRGVADARLSRVSRGLSRDCIAFANSPHALSPAPGFSGMTPSYRRGMFSGTDYEQAERLARALRAVAHPARLLALRVLVEADISPIELTRLLDRPGCGLGVVAYHVRRLRAAGIVELAGTIPRRGAVEHRYRLTAAGAAVEKAVRELAL